MHDANVRESVGTCEHSARRRETLNESLLWGPGFLLLLASGFSCPAAVGCRLLAAGCWPLAERSSSTSFLYVVYAFHPLFPAVSASTPTAPSEHCSTDVLTLASTLKEKPSYLPLGETGFTSC